MADKTKDKKDKPAAEASLASSPAPAAAKPPGVLKLFLFVAMPLMLVQAGVAYFLISKYSPAGPAASNRVVASDHPESAPDSNGDGSTSHAQGESKIKHRTAQAGDPMDDTKEEKANQYTHFVKDVIINPAATAGTRFLNVSMAFEYGRERLQRELESEDFRIRDALINILVSKRIDEIDGADDKERLRQELLAAVNGMLKTGRIRKIYFTNFVIQ
jgi:flagellar basal body-associated protein FliL